MKLTYHGHSCFSVESKGFTIVLDPYKDVEGFGSSDLEGNMVICSHDHFDHAFVEGVKITKGDNPFELSYIHCFHDEVKGLKRGKNVITVLEAEGKRLAHLGDLGHELGKEEIAQLSGVDVLMVPVGGFFTIDAETAIKVIKAINPKKVAPMHYRDGELDFDKIDDINAFLDLADDELKSKLVLVRAYEQSVEI